MKKETVKRKASRTKTVTEKTKAKTKKSSLATTTFPMVGLAGMTTNASTATNARAAVAPGLIPMYAWTKEPGWVDLLASHK